jgi:hypothetical protein
VTYLFHARLPLLCLLGAAVAVLAWTAVREARRKD